MKLFITLFGASLIALTLSKTIQPSSEYLPPETSEISAKSADENDSAAKLTDDGYEYKTIRKLKLRTHRQRRDLPTDEYLPPKEPTQEYLPPQEASSIDTKLADDGYEYRTVRKYKLRTHRQKRAAPTDEYLPPKVEEPTQEYLPPKDSAVDTKLADDGYRYRTVHRYKLRTHRQKRAVTDAEEPIKEYLPPVDDNQLDAEQKTSVADDGYRYKTVRRLKFRRSKRETEMEPTKDYLPPQQEADMQMEATPEVKSAELAADGYRYRTIRKTKYRRRI